jgi:type II secretory pathway pseudopilin PulG
LLVVIAIIGILASMTLVVIAKVREQGRKAEALREIHALHNAIQEYHSDTGTYPVSNEVLAQAIAAHGDFTFGDPPFGSVNNSEVMAILMDRQKYPSGAPSANFDHARNKRQKIYLNLPQADTANLPGLGPDLVFRDPWGTPYVISFDLNFDENCRDVMYEKSSVSKEPPGSGSDNGLNPTDPSGDKNDFYYRGGVMIWSLGPDKKADANRKALEAPNRDNIVSWR